jgi:hypothetical protein
MDVDSGLELGEKKHTVSCCARRNLSKLVEGVTFRRQEADLISLQRSSWSRKRLISWRSRGGELVEKKSSWFTHAVIRQLGRGLALVHDSRGFQSNFLVIAIHKVNMIQASIGSN